MIIQSCILLVHEEYYPSVYKLFMEHFYMYIFFNLHIDKISVSCGETTEIVM